MSTAEDETHPDIPEKSWDNPFGEGHPLHDMFARRIRNKQDLVIIIDDYHARRGTGKTVASLQLAEAMDQNGGLTWDNVSMSTEEIRNAYYQLPERSGLVFDEGEVGASNREAMTKSNRALREIMSMGRVEEKYVVINAPSSDFIDKDIKVMADLWITMLVKGIGLIHSFERQPYGRGKLLTPKKGMLKFSDIETGTTLRNVYNRLTREKRRHIRGEEGTAFVPVEEHEEELEKARKEARKEARNEAIRSFYDHPEHDEEVSYRTIAESLGISTSQVGNIMG